MKMRKGKNMKTNKIILGLALLIVYVNAQAETLKEKLIKQLTENRATLAAAKGQVTQAIKQLSDSYAKINTDVIGKIDSALPAIDSQTKGLAQAVNYLKQAPNLSLISTVCLGDLQPTLQWIIDNPIANVQSTLTDIRKNFAEANAPLDPAKENNLYKQPVYQKLATAEASFDKAITRISDVINILSKTNK
jgi:hypothetical protein